MPFIVVMRGLDGLLTCSPAFFSYQIMTARLISAVGIPPRGETLDLKRVNKKEQALND